MTTASAIGRALSRMPVGRAAAIVLLSISAARAGNYRADMPWEGTSARECSPQSLAVFYGDESNLSDVLAKCGIEIVVQDVNGQGWAYKTEPTTIFEPIDKPLQKASWEKVKYPPESRDVIVEWWTQNDDFEAGRTTFYRNDNGRLAYATTRFSWKKDLVGGVVTDSLGKDSEIVTRIKLVGKPAVVGKIKQRMVHAYVRNGSNEIEEWVFNGIEWKKSGKPIAKDAASDPVALAYSAHKFKVTPTEARLVRKFSCAGNWPKEKNPFSDLFLAGCWTCEGGDRTLAAVDGDKACKPVRQWSKIESSKKATGIIKTVCPDKPWFLHRLSGTCYRCPDGYERSLDKIGGSKACFKDPPAKEAKRLGEVGCQPGTFRNGLTNNCYECPGGGNRTIFPGKNLQSMSNACEQWDFTNIELYYLSTDGKIYQARRLYDGTWSSSSLPKGPRSQPFRVPGVTGLFAVDERGKLVYTHSDKKGDWIKWKDYHTQPPEKLAGPGFGNRHSL